MRRAVKNVHIPEDGGRGKWYGPDYEPLVPDDVAATITAPGVFEDDDGFPAFAERLNSMGPPLTAEERAEAGAAWSELSEAERTLIQAQEDAVLEAQLAIARNIKDDPGYVAPVDIVKHRRSDDDSGDLVKTVPASPLEDPEKSAPNAAGPAAAPSEWADLNVDDTLAKVHGGAVGEAPTDGWQERALEALEYEQGRSNPRKGVLEPLTLQLEQATSDGGADAVDS